MNNISEIARAIIYGEPFDFLNEKDHLKEKVIEDVIIGYLIDLNCFMLCLTHHQLKSSLTEAFDFLKVDKRTMRR